MRRERRSRLANADRRPAAVALARSGVRRQGFHDICHAAASLWLARGVSPPVVMELLRHSTITTTMSVYAHAIPSLERGAAGRMQEVLAGSA